MAASRARLILMAGAMIALAPARAPAAGVPLDARLYGVACNGSTDDTAAIQAALNTGLPVQLPPGVCKTSATLTFTTAAQQGQALIGAGETALDGGGAAKTVIRPTSAVSVALKIDGVGFTNYVQGVTIRDLTVDMAAMANAQTSVAFQQGQSFDIDYDHVRVSNFGTAKYSWLFGPGAFVTHLNTVQGGQLAVIGNGTQNPTTVTCTNCDIFNTSIYDAATVTFVGGAIQTPYGNVLGVIYLAPGTTPTNYPTSNTGGLYAAVMSKIDSASGVTIAGTDLETSGSYPATYSDGTHGTLPLVPVLQITGSGINNSLNNAVWGNMYPLDQGSTTTIAHIASAGTVVNETVTQNRAFRINKGAALYGYSADGAGQTFLLDASNGLASLAGIQLRPATDGVNFLNVFNAAGSQIGGMFSSATAANSLLFFNQVSGQKVLGQTSGGSTTITLDGNAGTIVSTGAITGAGGSFTTLSASSTVSGAGFSNYLASPPAIGGTTPAAASFTTVKTSSTTVAGLPSAATAGAGARAFVTDATACTFAATPTGGGSTKCPVYSDGSAWKAG